MDVWRGSRLVVAAIALIFFAALPSIADEPVSRTFDAKGVQIHYLVAGAGEPVVLIHGLHASAEINWNRPGVIGELARDHQVIALDLPGHGKSDKPATEDAYGLQLVEDVVLLLDHLKIEKAHIVGYSLGGMVTARLMATHPERVSSGTIGGMGWLRAGSLLQQVWERIPARAGGRTPPAFIHSVGKLALTEDELKKINVPVRIIVGERDPVKGLYVTPLQEVRSDWSVVEIEDAGHLNCIVKPQFLDEIAGWVRMQKTP